MNLKEEVESKGWAFVSGWLISELARCLSDSDIEKIATGLPREIVQFLERMVAWRTLSPDVSALDKIILATRKRSQV